MLLKDGRLRLLNRMLGLVWPQWTTLDVSGNARLTEKWVLDPETLVLFTCTIGRYEPRIFDSMLEWLSFNQRLLNIQRLKTINRRGNFAGKQLLAAIASNRKLDFQSVKLRSFIFTKCRSEGAVRSAG